MTLAGTWQGPGFSRLASSVRQNEICCSLAYGRGAAAYVQSLGLKAVAAVYLRSTNLRPPCPSGMEVFTGVEVVRESTKEKRRKIDQKVGRNLRVIRSAKGFSQQKLSSEIGLTFQQLQKYESGTNRISASVLFHLSQILEVEIKDFFCGLSTASSKPIPPLSKDHYELIRFYDSAPRNVQKCLLKFLETIANGDGNA
jgi:transcriptional regulator with XRE-family HTH domain